MRIHVHDFSGHPFQAQLSRALAAEGHQVRHSYSSSYVSGKGKLAIEPGDPQSLSFEPVSCERELDKYDFRRRLRYEVSFGRALTERLLASRPEVVVLCNIPLLSLRYVSRQLSRHRIPFVLWHQDIFYRAMAEEVHRRLPKPLAATAARFFQVTERDVARRATRIVCIGPAFRRQYDAWGIDPATVDVVPNWAPVGEIVPAVRDNAWAHEVGLPAAPVRLLYSGTLGRKHNPLLLLDLVDRSREAGLEVDLTVVSEGVGADLLGEEASRRRLPVRVLPFQPSDRFSQVLSSADFLLGLLEPEASQFSIPSKVLSYLCAGRPILGFMAADNPAAADIQAAGGATFPPTQAGIEPAVTWLRDVWRSPGRHESIGVASRRRAEEKFDIGTIRAEFERILRAAVVPAGSHRPVLPAR